MSGETSAFAPKRRRDAQKNHEALLAAARAMIAESGPDGLKVVEVAARARVNRTTAYQHFRTRADLIAAVLEQLAVELLELLSPETPIKFDSILEYLVAHPELSRLWMFQVVSDIQPEDHEGWDRFVEIVTAFASSDAAVEGIDPEMLANILMAAVLVWPVRVQGEAPGGAKATRVATERYARELKRLLLYGAGRPEALPEIAAELEAAPSKAARRKKEK